MCKTNQDTTARLIWLTILDNDKSICYEQFIKENSTDNLLAISNHKNEPFYLLFEQLS